MERSHRKAVLRNLATSIILFESVKTTPAKAKQVVPMVEKLITTAKGKDTMNVIRQIDRVVFDKNAGKKLIEELGVRYKDRNGGYVRVVKAGNRAGDNAPQVLVQLIKD